MENKGLETLLAVSVVAALAPAVASLLPRKPPQVVVLIVCGVLIGPSVLGLGDSASIKVLADVGLGFLFLLAGYELDPGLLRERSGRLAIGGWLISAVIAVGAAGGLTYAGFVKDFVPIGLALTTTALGTLLPILKDNDMLGGQFGRYVLAAGAAGELFPILAISLFLTRRGEFGATISILVVCAAAALLAIAPRLMGEARLGAIIRQGQRATAQTTLRWAIVLLLILLVLAERFGLDVVLGALIAGIVLRNWTKRMGVDITSLEEKLDAVGYGFFIPLFFVASGMSLDVASIAANPLRLIVFLALLLVVRGLPSLFVYRRALPLRQRVEMTFITATTMPLLIALAQIGLADGIMLKANAAALVGAGVCSVLLYPLVAVALARKPGALLRLPQARDALSDANAHRRRAAAAAAPPQLVQQCGRDPGSRASKRMPDGDRAAVDIDQLRVALELINDGNGLRGERLVDLEQCQVTDLPAGPAQRLAHRRHRPDPHVVGVHPRAGAARVASQRFGARPLHGTLGHQQQAGRAVVQRRGVTAGDRAAGPERWLLRGEFGCRQAGLDPLVLADGPLRRLDRHDLASEPAAGRGRRRPLMAEQRELVLPFAADLVLIGNVLRGLPQADRRVELGHPRADQPPAKPGVHDASLARERLGRPRHDKRRPGHRLDPAGDADIGVPGRDRPRGRANRLHARTAQPVHRGTRHLDRQAGQQHAHPGHVPVVLTCLVGRAPVHVVNGLRVKPRVARHQRGDHVSGQMVRPDASQGSLDLPDRRAACVHGVYGGHRRPPAREVKVNVKVTPTLSF